jgi:DMSO/TMAO reductase YedYZ molybdopterin-dependent catalytic subunit
VIPESYKWRLRSPGDGGQLLLTRRALLAFSLARALKAEEPEVSNFDFSLLDDWLTPVDLFFVREHFPAPKVSSAGWKLSVTGAVANPLEVGLDDLTSEPRKTLPVTIECAENPVAGGLVSHAEWSGVTLAPLLAKAAPAAEAKSVKLSAADGFSHSIPLAKALHPDTLIVDTMNGEKLPLKHGFPLRAVVPGWYGMDSVKWLRSVEVLTSDPADRTYVRQVRSLLMGTRLEGPVTAMNVKSTFSRPVDGAILMGRSFIVRGVAWAGENRVRQVEVSVDGGKSWRIARLNSAPQPYAWVHWSFEWAIGGPGPYELTVRATDDRGRVQPEGRPPDRVDAYEWNACQTIRVVVT